MLKLIRANLPFFLPYFIFLLLGGVLQVSYDKNDLFFFVNQHYHWAGDSFFTYFTHVGDGLFYAGVILILLFVQYRYALAAALSFGFTSLVAQLLKRLAFDDALRPVKYYEHSSFSLHTVDGVTLHGFNSFPSGHATTAFSVFCLLALVVKNKTWGYVFFVLAFLTAYSRVYLAQHFPADIYAGATIGGLLTLITCQLVFDYCYKYPKQWHTMNIQSSRKAGHNYQA